MVEAHVTYIQPLSAIAATDVHQSGGKGATLARLWQAGLPVPSGCIVTAQALTAFLEAQTLPTAPTVEAVRQILCTGEPPATLRQELHVVLQELTQSATGWAVRSSTLSEDSATASFAGVYESFLEVHERDLWPSIQACWASWWSPRALAYRQRLENFSDSCLETSLPPLPEEKSWSEGGRASALPCMAVVIQTMVAARCAGVAFTVEPMHGDPTRMVINAAPGLGVTVVSGVVEPEQYILAKEQPCRLLETRVLQPNQAPLLPPEALARLGELLQRIEQLCGSPQDVEWAWDGTQCWIVQSRPITTLARGSEAAAETVWSNGNLKDVMPGLVSPLTWSLMRQQLEAAMREQYTQVGYTVPAEVPLIRRFWGRPYFNLSVFQAAAYTLYGSPPEKQAAQLGGAMVRGFTPHGPASLWQRLHWLQNALRFRGIAEQARKTAATTFAAIHRQWQEELHHAPQLDRATLLHKLETFADITYPFLLQHLHLTWAMSGTFSYLKDYLMRHMPHAANDLMANVLTGIGGVSSADHSYRLWELSRLARQSTQVMAFLQRGAWSTWQEALADTPFGHAWQAFLETFGHRSLYEVEMANPRWREQPDYVFEMLTAYAALEQDHAPFDPHQQARRRQAAEHEVLRHVPFWRRAWWRTIMRHTQEFSRLRENSKSHLVQLIDIGRCMALRAAAILVSDGILAEPEAVFFLEIDELRDALRRDKSAAEITRLITQRRLERQRYAALQPPEAFVGERPLYDDPAPTGPGMVLRGLPSSPGRVTGPACVLRSPHDGSRLHAGDILVAPSTDPGWTPLFLLAAGLVMETGGYLSHGAIVAREYGIPAILNVSGATQRIPDGSIVMLDGGEGTVRMVEDEVHDP